MTASSDGVDELSDVSMVNAVPNDTLAKPDVISTESTESSVSVFEEGCNEIADLASACADVDKSKSDPVLI